MKPFQNIYLKTFLVFIISFVYAIVRYNVFGNVPCEDIPLFISNKAISLTSVLLLLFTIKKEISKEKRVRIWKIIFFLISIHVFISFRLLGPEYYGKFYSDNEINIVGYSTLLFGILAFLGILLLNSDGMLPTENGKLTLPNSLKNWIRTAIPYLILIHIFFVGISSWLTPFKWYGYLIPISLIAFISIITFLYRKKVK